MEERRKEPRIDIPQDKLPRGLVKLTYATCPTHGTRYVEQYVFGCQACTLGWLAGERSRQGL